MASLGWTWWVKEEERGPFAKLLPLNLVWQDESIDAALWQSTVTADGRGAMGFGSTLADARENASRHWLNAFGNGSHSSAAGEGGGGDEEIAAVVKWRSSAAGKPRRCSSGDAPARTWKLPADAGAESSSGGGPSSRGSSTTELLSPLPSDAGPDDGSDAVPTPPLPRPASFSWSLYGRPPLKPVEKNASAEAATAAAVAAVAEAAGVDAAAETENEEAVMPPLPPPLQPAASTGREGAHSILAPLPPASDSRGVYDATPASVPAVDVEELSCERRGVTAEEALAAPKPTDTQCALWGAAAGALKSAGLTATSEMPIETFDGAASDAGADDLEVVDDRPLALHRAVFEGRPGDEIAALARRRPAILEEKDHHSHTPLLLALKLGRVECAEALLAAGASTDVKSDVSFHLLDEACACGDMQLLRAVYTATQKSAWRAWQARVPGLLAALAKVPDFYVEMRWEFDAAAALAPVVRAVAPSDTYRVWKKGTWLRVDSTIAGVSRRLQLRRGRTSLVLLGHDSPRPGQLMRIDHAKRKVYDALRRLERMTPHEVDRACRRLVASSKKKVEAFDFKANNVEFSPSSSTFSRKGQRTATICGYECRAFECTGDVELLVLRKGANVVRGLPEALYFDTTLSLAEAVARNELEGRQAAGGYSEKGGAAAASSSSGGGGKWGWSPFGGSSDKGRKTMSGGVAVPPPPPGTAADPAKPHRKVERRIKATMWIADTFPLKLNDVLPVIEVVAMRDDLMQRLRDVLGSAGVPKGGFPVRASVPLMLSIKAVVSFENYSNKPEDLADSIFELPREYDFSRRLSAAVYSGLKPGGSVEDGWGAGIGGIGGAAAVSECSSSDDGDGEDPMR